MARRASKLKKIGPPMQKNPVGSAIIGGGVKGAAMQKVEAQRRSNSDADSGHYSHPRSPNAERSAPGGAYHPVEPYRAPSFIATSLLP